MPTLTFYPPNSGTSIEFSETEDAPYHLLMNYDGFAYMPASHKTVQSPGQHGLTCYDSLASPRIVTFDIQINSADISEQKTLVTALATALNPLLGDGVLKYASDDGTDYTLYCRNNGGPALSTDERTALLQRATITLIAHDPFFYSGSPHLLTLAQAADTFFPFEFPFTFPTSTLSGTADNNGSFETPVTITLNGPIKDAVITRVATESGVSTTRIFSITLDLAAGEQFVITTGKGTQTATYIETDGTENSGEPYVDLTSEYWMLQPGTNTITLTYDTASSHDNLCQIQWSDKYVGVG